MGGLECHHSALPGVTGQEQGVGTRDVDCCVCCKTVPSTEGAGLLTAESGASAWLGKQSEASVSRGFVAEKQNRVH